MPETVTLWLIRHAEPDEPSNGRVCLGRTLDLPLGEAGRTQARLLAARMKDVPLHAIYMSPLRRARETAQALPHACPRIVTETLTEVSGGVWDGMCFSDIHRLYPAWFDGTRDDPPPGGETDGEALDRVMTLLRRLSDESGKSFALVTHSGLGRILLCSILGMPMRLKRTIPMSYASVARIVFCEGRWRVVSQEEPVSQ